ncbi:phosphate ABC transporter permease subunit PstC [Desulfosporosinus sp.]|uniref:phosphate ABC transporter permease subunit PstC n=1 Tax=Desulfosporosinus sp. TaxID=157907 RepID=UPI0025C4AEA6|nr:phosphate ABC transporter permease subunit PstC [Desulfosporosinus sp.]MBC2724091.1 phosphate ABC transporter permease subunit PstC [Desulfosporosinus sp.]MBC2727568.1 phosphate ABC transporter permease subunit PstC [Desulfosporosinus sp.]
MDQTFEKLFIIVCTIFTVISIGLLFLVIVFISKESMQIFQEVSFLDFISGLTWNPLANEPAVGILPMILATFYVSIVAVLISLPIGIGCALELAALENERLKGIFTSILGVLAGIPSVIYGFIGLLVVVKFFETTFMFATGESILSGGIVLAVMVLPYIVSSATETMEKSYKKYKETSQALGVSKSYMLRALILPNAKGAILTSMILAFSRAMGETMAVMMVIGNSPILPKLLGKGETIPALIALEIGTAGLGSLHYHGLFTAGFVLMMFLIFLNALFYLIKKNLTEHLE